MGRELTKMLEKTLEVLDDAVFKQENLEKAEYLNELFKEIEPDRFHYSVEQAAGLPAIKK